MRIMTTINIHSFGVQVMKNTLVSCDSIKQEERKKHSIYSTGRKSWIFCFALLLPQILVNFQIGRLSFEKKKKVVGGGHFLILHIMVFRSWSKKKIEVSQLFFFFE